MLMQVGVGLSQAGDDIIAVKAGVLRSMNHSEGIVRQALDVACFWFI